MKHPLDMKGNNFSYEAANIFLTKESSKSGLKKIFSFLFNKLDPCLSVFCRVSMYLVYIGIWCYQLITDIIFINSFQKISISQVFQNETMISYQTITFDLHFNMMTAALVFYIAYFFMNLISYLYVENSNDLTIKTKRYNILYAYLGDKKFLQADNLSILLLNYI